MTTQEILSKYLNFYKEKGHVQISNASLVPENDPSLLFVNSGMFPLVPYLMGSPHPGGTRITNVQRSLRLDDIKEVGDARHTTVFHMIGNWSLGDYFKQEQLTWVYEFLVETLGLNPNNIFATVFEGDENSPKDTESMRILESIFKKYNVDLEGRILARGKKDNWWQRGEAIGELGGPDSEIFYYIGNGDHTKMDLTGQGNDFLEIGNSVFMQYIKTATGWEELAQKNVDFGGGLERIALVVQNKRDIFETDSFWPIIQTIETLSGKSYKDTQDTTKQMRILADHIRATVLIAMDGVVPSNKEQGYILRRLLRRMVRAGKNLEIDKAISVNLVSNVVKTLAWLYPELQEKEASIRKLFAEEEERFSKTLESGARQVRKQLTPDITQEKLAEIATSAFQSLGYPLEFTLDDARDAGIEVDEDIVLGIVAKNEQTHKQTSRKGASDKFTGGLADKSETTIKYHTTTHLLQWALREVFGDNVQQQGSNITGERLRFDFSLNEKLTEDQVNKVESLINDKIAQKINVGYEIMPKEQAEKIEAIHLFNEKYGKDVKVYYIGDGMENAFSREFCGGPHVRNTSEIPPVSIFKQEKIGNGKIRLYLKFTNS